MSSNNRAYITIKMAAVLRYLNKIRQVPTDSSKTNDIQ